MTISRDSAITRHTGNGVRTTFLLDFPLLGGLNILVIVDNQIATDYTSSLTAVTFDTPPLVGADILFVRWSNIDQLINWEAFGNFDAPLTEFALDKLTLLAQEAEGFRADDNIAAAPVLDGVEIWNDKGNNGFIPIFSDDLAGMFAGEVTETMPIVGTVTDKPTNFLYMEYDETVVVDNVILTGQFNMELITEADIAKVRLLVLADGRVFWTTYIFAATAEIPQEVVAWHRLAGRLQNPELYEIRVDTNFGDAPTEAPDWWVDNVWQPMDSQPSAWGWQAGTIDGPPDSKSVLGGSLQIREIANPSDEGTLTYNVDVQTGIVPP